MVSSGSRNLAATVAGCGVADHDESLTEFPTEPRLVTTFGGVSALGALLCSLREATGLTQEQLAELSGVSSRTISDTERGLRTRIYADTAKRLATGLGLDE